MDWPKALRVRLKAGDPLVEFLKEQDYDAKGQRQFARYGNDVLTRYFNQHYETYGREVELVYVNAEELEGPHWPREIFDVDRRR